MSEPSVPESANPAPGNDELVAPAKRPRKSGRIPALLVGIVVAVLAAGATLLRRAEANTNSVALSSTPKGVTVVTAKATTFRETRRYVGTLEPWQQARLGPQLVSAYVSSVLVRPGAAVKKGEIVATLDCRNSSSANRSVALQAQALQERQRALVSETSRFQSLLDHGFVSPNEVEQRQAQTASEGAQLAALQAQSQGKRLEVDDCVLRAPFDGEVAARAVDPGAFVRPGTALVTLVDRHLLRLVADVPETDFDAVAVGTPVDFKLLSNQLRLRGAISRRSPMADGATRTVRFEVDIDPEGRDLATGSTAEVAIEVGQALPAIQIPLVSAKVRGSQVTVFVVDGNLAKRRTVPLVGERAGTLFVTRELPANTLVVMEGRGQLLDGDKLVYKEEAPGETGATAK